MSKWFVMGCFALFGLIFNNLGGAAFACAVVLVLTWND